MPPPRQYQGDWFMAPSGNPHWVAGMGQLGNWLGQGATWFGNQMAPGLTPSNPQFIFGQNSGRHPLGQQQSQPQQQPAAAQPQLPPPAGSPAASNWARGVFDFGGGQQNAPSNASFVMTTNGPQAVTGQHQFSGAPVLNPGQGSGGMSLAEVQRIVNQANGVGGGANAQLPPMAQQTVNQALNAPNPMRQAFGSNKL